MEYVLIGVTALGASLLTFFSGFGLGTLLTVVFLQFFPIREAILLTAIVHLLNNVFKTIIMLREIDKKVLALFGLTAIAGAFLGAYVLNLLPSSELTSYSIGERSYSIHLINCIIGALLIAFAIAELVPKLHFKVNQKMLAFGGFLSGFFGGLSGHQGALRSSFLLKLNLKKEVFIGTGIAVSMLIDFTRIGTYFQDISFSTIENNLSHILAGVIPALVGSILGKLYLKKLSYQLLHYFVAIAIIVFSIALILGLMEK